MTLMSRAASPPAQPSPRSLLLWLTFLLCVHQVVDDHTSRGARLLGGVKVRALLARVSNACTRALTHHHVL